MRLLAIALPMALLAPPSAPHRLPALVRELHEADRPSLGCLEGEPMEQQTDARLLVGAYQARWKTASPETARLLLEARIDYVLRPSQRTFEAMRDRLRGVGGRAAAEDVCRCVDQGLDQWDGRAARMEQVEPPAVGQLWAGHVLHVGGRTADALVRYRRVLDASPDDPRALLLAAVASVAERRPQDALDLLARIPSGWANEPVGFWRAQALFDGGDARAAQKLLDALPAEWVAAPTEPDAFTDSGPVQFEPVCLRGTILAETGDVAGAQALWKKGGYDCRGLEARRLLRAGQPFEALLEFQKSAFIDDPLALVALARLGACEWAREDAAQFAENCASTYPGRGCSDYRAVEPEVAATCPAGAAVSATDGSLLARLRAPRITAFEERAVPSGLRTRRRADEKPRAVPELGDASIAFASRKGERMFAVSLSSDVDPRGEVSSGGYWLHLSSDRGRTWRGPYYLGFAEQFPSVVQPSSRLPAWDGERLNLEVVRREVDPESITFPPVALRAKRVEADRYLSVDVDAVTRDSDEDGLTDLLEEKLALDPEAADTDGDGMADDRDPLPLQPYDAAAEAQPLQELLAAVLPEILGGPSPILHTAAGDGEGSTMSFGRHAFASNRTLFVSGADAVLPHAAGVRAIAIPSDALAAYKDKFGATYPLELPDVAFDEQRTRAVVRYSFGWRGGTLVAERADGVWKVVELTNWIT